MKSTFHYHVSACVSCVMCWTTTSMDFTPFYYSLFISFSPGCNVRVLGTGIPASEISSPILSLPPSLSLGNLIRKDRIGLTIARTFFLGFPSKKKFPLNVYVLIKSTSLRTYVHKYTYIPRQLRCDAVYPEVCVFPM